MFDNWREKFRRLGMRQVTTWVPKDQAEQLQYAFTQIGAVSFKGKCLRAALDWVLTRRRPLDAAYKGSWFKLEIDQPTLWLGNLKAPIGGRVHGDGKTLIELDPYEAKHLEKTCQEAVNSVLAAWLDEKGLKDQIRDTTGVVADVNALTRFRDKPWTPDPATPKTEKEFEEHEVLVQQDFQRRAFYGGAFPPDDPSMHLYFGFWNSPSRCRLVHGTFEGTLCVGFIHVRYGGTSPTNYIENLAQEIRQKFYPKTSPAAIAWYDIWPEDNSLTHQLRFNRVTFAEGFSRPSWGGEQPPETFVEQVKQTIEAGKTAEAIAHLKANPGKPWKLLLDPSVRQSYGDFHADIVEANVSVIACLGSWPRGSNDFGLPYLFISLPGGYDFRHKESCEALLEHWGDDAKILARGSLIDSWDDPDLIRFCKRAKLPLDEARLYYTAQAKKED